MEGGCSASPPSDPNNFTAGSGGGTLKLLANLPSRGLFSSTVISSNPGGMRVYICDHETSPAANQIIKTNQTNILIRSLMLKNEKGDSSTAANLGSRKRAAEKTLDGKAAGKKAMYSSQIGASQEGSSRVMDNLQSLTVDRLRALLKEKGLSVKGKKDELISRLRGVNG
ncbi:hypothetical protein ACJIZ3_004469 [Penstemon smallii]|uniref:SAP domain-containing protein n=1 Tax=Penstemon smallii TaxID=265156 RepID=A0ABD3S244_9LAMI